MENKIEILTKALRETTSIDAKVLATMILDVLADQSNRIGKLEADNRRMRDVLSRQGAYWPAEIGGGGGFSIG